MLLIYHVIFSPIVLSRWDSEDRLHSKYSDGFQLIPNLCLMQCLNNFKLSTREREEYTGHEILWVFTVVANPRSKKSSMAPQLKLRPDQPTSLVFFKWWRIVWHHHLMLADMHSFEWWFRIVCRAMSVRLCCALFIPLWKRNELWKFLCCFPFLFVGSAEYF